MNTQRGVMLELNEMDHPLFVWVPSKGTVRAYYADKLSAEEAQAIARDSHHGWDFFDRARLHPADHYAPSPGACALVRAAQEELRRQE